MSDKYLQKRTNLKKIQFLITTCPVSLWFSTYNGNLGGARQVTQKALNGLSSHRQVSVQEAVHLVDHQDFVICSDSFITLSLWQGALMIGKDDEKALDIVSMWRNRSPGLHCMLMDEYFYKHFCSNVLHDKRDGTEWTKHRILIPKVELPTTVSHHIWICKRCHHPTHAMVKIEPAN